MRKTTKRWLIAAASLVVIGVIMIAAVSAFHWEYTDLSTEQYETNTYEINEEFRSIAINTDTADITFAASDACRVVSCERESVELSVEVRDGTLTVNAVDTGKWYEHIGFNFRSPGLTVYLPGTDYGSLVISESTGDVVIPDRFAFDSIDVSLSSGDVFLSAASRETARIQSSTGAVNVTDTSLGELELRTSTGEITVSGVTCQGDIRISVTTGETELENVVCRNLVSVGSTGDISLERVTAAEKFSIERSTGDVEFDASDAAGIFVKTDTGDVTGSLLSEKVFIPESSTGSIRVPKTATGGTCEIITSTGDIRMEIN